MSNSKKVFIGALGLIMAANVNTATAATPARNQAQAPVAVASTVEDPAILFKIHDIKPVMNSEGQTASCDFAITFFNRSDELINGASLDLSWDDESIKMLLGEEKKENALGPKKTNMARTTTDNITINIEVPALHPMKQVDMRTRIQTDRCFLLMNDTKARVRSCNVASQARAGSRSANVCSGLFRFVSPNSPEFYREFTGVSIAKEEEQKNNLKDTVKKDINNEYSAAVAEFERASQLLQEIK